MKKTLSKAKAMELWNEHAVYMGEDLLPLNTLGKLLEMDLPEWLEKAAKEHPEYILESDWRSLGTVKFATLDGFLYAVRMNNICIMADAIEMPPLWEQLDEGASRTKKGASRQ